MTARARRQTRCDVGVRRLRPRREVAAGADAHLARDGARQAGLARARQHRCSRPRRMPPSSCSAAGSCRRGSPTATPDRRVLRKPARAHIVTGLSLARTGARVLLRDLDLHRRCAALLAAAGVMVEQYFGQHRRHDARFERRPPARHTVRSAQSRGSRSSRSPPHAASTRIPSSARPAATRTKAPACSRAPRSTCARPR